jgi:adenosylmethionine-8-amino-7-oxononanoate aminotransferase
VTLGKGLGGGYTPIAAVIAHKRVWDGFREEPRGRLTTGRYTRRILSHAP